MNQHRIDTHDIKEIARSVSSAKLRKMMTAKKGSRLGRNCMYAVLLERRHARSKSL